MIAKSNVQCDTCIHKGLCKYEDGMRSIVEMTITGVSKDVEELELLGLSCNVAIKCDKFQPVQAMFR